MSEESATAMWGIVEIMGHLRVAGRLSDYNLGGTTLLRVDVPAAEGEYTRLFGGSAIYSVLLVDEPTARAFVARNHQRPLYPFELLAAP